MSAAGPQPRRPSWLLVAAVAAAVGFLAGVLVVVLLGAARGPDTGTVTRTQTGASPPVVVSASVPDVTDQRLDDAEDALHRAGFKTKRTGGGLLGVIVTSNWKVRKQLPEPGRLARSGSTVVLDVERR